MRNKIAEQDHDEAWASIIPYIENATNDDEEYFMNHGPEKENCPGCAKINEWLEIAYREGWIDGNERGTDGIW